MAPTLLLVIVAAIFEVTSARSRSHPPPQAFIVEDRSAESGNDQSPVQLLVPMVVVEDRSDEDNPQAAWQKALQTLPQQQQSLYLGGVQPSEVRAPVNVVNEESEEENSLGEALGRVLTFLDPSTRGSQDSSSRGSQSSSRVSQNPSSSSDAFFLPRVHEHAEGELCPACLVLHALKAIKLASAIENEHDARSEGHGAPAAGCSVCMLELQSAARRSAGPRDAQVSVSA